MRHSMLSLGQQLSKQPQQIAAGVLRQHEAGDQALFSVEKRIGGYPRVALDRLDFDGGCECVEYDDRFGFRRVVGSAHQSNSEAITQVVEFPPIAVRPTVNS